MENNKDHSYPKKYSKRIINQLLLVFLSLVFSSNPPIQQCNESLTESFSKIIELGDNINTKHPLPIGNEILLLFDIDNCLYKNVEVDRETIDFVKELYLRHVHPDESQWIAEQREYHLYGKLSSRFLQSELVREGYKSLPNIEKHVEPDSELKNLLKRIKFRKFCFTNGTKDRAIHILNYLQLTDVFEGVFCTSVDNDSFLAKPNPKSFKFVEEYLGIEDVNKIYFFDDSSNNIKRAKELGWNAIEVKDDIKGYIEELSMKIPLFNE